jgi:membrane-associated phospholipid phosphatase
LNTSRIPSFDRISLRQNVDRYTQAEESSDIGITWGTLTPAVLIVLDRRMRKDWIDVALTYLEAQTLTSNFYAWSFLGPTFIERFRPITYYAEIPLEERQWGGNRNSFYSGHVSVSAVTTFFMAQSYIDYHPEHRNLRWLYYGMAAIPPAIIGVKRIHALKHFPSDVTVGFVVGVVGGAVLPQIHKANKAKRLRLSILYEPEWKALGCMLLL